MAASSTSNPKQFLRTLETKLRSIAGRVRLLSIVQGIGKLLMGGFVFFLISFFLDFLIPDLPPVVRQVLLVAGLGVLGYLIWQELLLPLRSSLSPKDVARRLENVYPELNDRLISTLELVESAEQENPNISGRMVQKLVDDLEQVVPRLRLSNILNVEASLRWLGLGLLCVALFTLFAVRFPRETRVWGQRLIGQPVKWPKATLLSLESDPDQELIEGKSIRLRASADPESKRIPNNARLVVRYQDGTRKEITVEGEKAEETGKQLYSYMLKGVRDAFEYSFQAGDGQTRTGTVRLLKRPRIGQLQVRYDYPEYTQKQDTPEGEPETARKLKAPFDTVAEVTAPVSTPIEQARAFLEISGEPEELPVTVTRSTDQKASEVRTEVPFRKDGRLYFELYLKSQTGDLPEEPCVSLTAVCSAKFTVKTSVDVPARIKINYPGRNKHATPQGVIPVKSEAEDDFGIKSIRLQRKVNDGEPEEVTYRAKHNNQPYESKTITSTYRMDLNELGVSKGDRVTYVLFAEDVGTRNEPTQSRQYQFSIISTARMEEQLQKLQEKIRDRLEELTNDQQELRQHLSYNLSNIKKEKTDAMSEKGERQLTQRRNKQRSLVQKMKRINRQIQTLHRDASFNNLWNRRSREKLKTIFDLSSSIRYDEMPPAADQLAKALNAFERKKRVSFAQNALDQQNRILDRLDMLLNMMEEWKNLADFVHDWKNLQKDLKDLREDFIERSGK